MTSTMHASEERLATLACAGRSTGRVLIGGLGMGFTLRAVLDGVGAAVEVVVAELSPQVVAWNRGPLAHLAGSPLEDPRVRLALGDVARQFERGAAWDAVMLDADNGPSAMTGGINEGLYSLASLCRMRQSMAAGGTLAVWSASGDPHFEAQLRRAGFAAESHRAAAAVRSRGRAHTIFVGRVGGQ